MAVTVQLKKVVTVQAAKVVKLEATLDDGTVVEVTGPVSEGDYNITSNAGQSGILSAADFSAQLVSPLPPTYP